MRIRRGHSLVVGILGSFFLAGFVQAQHGHDHLVAATGAMHILKCYDANLNGKCDPGEPISGWPISISGPGGYSKSGLSGDADIVTVCPLAPGDYTVTEGTPVETNWVATGVECGLVGGPLGPCTSTSLPSATATVVGNSNSCPDNPTMRVFFANACIASGGSKTRGFWTNRNGKTAWDTAGNSNEITLLMTLNLRKYDGSGFDPATYDEFRAWVLDSNATNMALMLSVQLATMALNVNSNFVSGGAMVSAQCLLNANFPTTPGLTGGGFISISNLIAAANASLGANGSTFAGSPDRAYQQCLESILDAANQDVSTIFVSPTPCAATFSTPR